jgi:predicted O-methyltransferase YrrM
MDNCSSTALDALAAQVKGFLDPAEGHRLLEVALEAGRLGPCLEIGSYCGKSSLFLGTACRLAGTVLFSIDHHQGSEEQQPGQSYFDPELFDARWECIDTLPFFRHTLARAGFTDTVVPLVCRSTLAARTWATPLGLVFIDGGHSFQDAFADYNAWAGHIRPGGYLLIHDIFPDPRKGGQAPWQVYRLALASGLFEPLEMTGCLGVLRRHDHAHAPTRPDDG